MTFLRDFISKPPLEDELETEKQIRELLKCDDRAELKRMCADLLRENCKYNHFVVQCLESIANLQEQLVHIENRIEPKKELWWHKFIPL